MKARSLSMKFLLMERPQAEHSGSIGQPSNLDRDWILGANLGKNYFSLLFHILSNFII